MDNRLLKSIHGGAISLLILLALGIMLFAGGCSRDKGDEEATTATKADVSEDAEVQAPQTVINIFQYKVEIARELEALAREYEKEYPNVTINVKTNAGRDYQAMLRAEFVSGNQPDIFNLTGFREVELWRDYTEDLSDQPWISIMKPGVLDAITDDGKVVGMPYNIEGYGIIYNKAIFKEVGITELPETMEDYLGICRRLDDYGVLPFYNAYKEWWTLTMHSFNAFLGSHEDVDVFIDDLVAGRISLQEDEYAYNWLDYIDLMTDYGQDNPFITGYSAQIEAFVDGKAAMIQQGNWIQDWLDELNPELELGILPIPINDDSNDAIPIGVPSYWCVNSQSEVREEAKAFLDWMVSSETGKRYLIEEFRFIPAFTGLEDQGDKLGELGREVSRYADEGRTYGWYWAMLPVGFTNAIIDDIEEYLDNQITREELLTRIEDKMRK